MLAGTTSPTLMINSKTATTGKPNERVASTAETRGTLVATRPSSGAPEKIIAIGNAASGSIATRNLAGAAEPAHHIAYDATAIAYGRTISDNSTASRGRRRAN